MKRLIALMTTGLLLMAVAAPVVAKGGPAAQAFPLYATGDIGCDGAEDRDLRGGRGLLRPTKAGVAFQVVLTNAAADWEYYVEVQEEFGGCIYVLGLFDGFRTNHKGKGVFRGMLPLAPGTYSLNIDVVSAEGSPPDYRHREIGGFGYVEVRVPE